MDPIQPIAPLSPNLPPITPVPTARRVERDSSRPGYGSDQRRRRRPQPDGDPADPGAGRFDYAQEDVGEDPDGEDDSGLHVNVTA